ncbi:hypothetical protein GWI33_008490 [Rhynchophorus ferrugineus]|uniref:Uncharacterized protein n=1 Tax=Rhynchophorus ferrugineus TaxID=354439 RepID=A0A834IGM6_RHYFE|nr:hypothetical protein GWI33_008490 [Rhynchophorus ferrugineus]
MKYICIIFCVFVYIATLVTSYPANAVDKHVSQQKENDQIDDVVDFGAHTGDNGAFGWYADFPVHANTK